MIPIKLTISNFMPYRDNVPPLSFAGIHTASICGDNGSGKSSLIDAMTWALWGKSRARSDDDLIHQGQVFTQVEFEFAVGQQTYRVIRKHARPKSRRTSGQSSLDLFIAGNGSFKPISGDRIGDTQSRITDILHMDYETFVNSAFLRQGHADEFTVAKPTERKAVLTSILGLSTYDRLEERARQAATLRAGETEQLVAAVKQIDTELSRKEEYEEELARAQSQLGDVEALLSACEASLNVMRAQRELLRAKQQQHAQLDEQIAHATRDLSRWSDQAKQHRTRAAEYAALIARRTAVEEGYSALIDARKLNEELSQKLRVITGLKERQHQLEMAIEKASQALVREHALAETRIAELQTRHNRLEKLRSDLHQAQTQAAKLTETEAALRIRRQELQGRLAETRRLESDRTRTEREIAEIDEKLDLLTSQIGARCPLCEQELGTGHIDLIRAKYAGDKQSRSALLKSIHVDADRNKAETARLETELGRAETGLNQAKAASQGKISLLEREVSEAEESGAQLEGHKARLGEIEERMARKDFAVAEQEAYRRLDSQIEALGYDPSRHEGLRAEMAGLEQYEGPKRKLEEADRLEAEEKESALRAEQAAAEIRLNLDSYNKSKVALAAELEVLPGVTSRLAQAETEYRELGSRQRLARETMGGVKERLDRCAQLEIVKKAKEAQLTTASAEEGIYRELAGAFGKRGVQALLIEMALPEIESEANRLLARMTDNRMHVRFETQRETKKGDMLETLDIYIADELGTRSYEMFSGGEAFRINFAVRIALSKLLARRAGAPLPTLIIDEGFGTQDATGMEKLKEAITSVQDDFEKILVITHIEDFRDAFPVRIDVVKTPDGSTISMN